MRTLISRRELAERLGCSPHTLAIWALKGVYLPVIKVGSRAMYDPADIERFIEARKRSSTSETLAPATAASLR
jgi:DNA-binding transcriptional MerR regulator